MRREICMCLHWFTYLYAYLWKGEAEKSVWPNAVIIHVHSWTCAALICAPMQTFFRQFSDLGLDLLFKTHEFFLFRNKFSISTHQKDVFRVQTTGGYRSIENHQNRFAVQKRLTVLRHTYIGEIDCLNWKSWSSYTKRKLAESNW